jgi:hypothetical protein
MVDRPVKIADADGTEYDLSEEPPQRQRKSVVGTTPFCDGTHEKTNFAAVNRTAGGPTSMSSPAVASR